MPTRCCAPRRPTTRCWVARFGRLVEKRPGDQYGILYDTLVNTVRPRSRRPHFIHAKATAIATSRERQTVTLSNGEEVSARLVVLANGLNIGLRHKLGIRREVMSPAIRSASASTSSRSAGRASISGADLLPRAPSDRMAYLTLFPIGTTMRANLFVYRDMDDPWLRRIATRHARRCRR